MPPRTSGHLFEIGLETDDIAATMNELRVYGVTIIKEPEMSLAGIRYTYIADPDGTWISLYQTKKN